MAQAKASCCIGPARRSFGSEWLRRSEVEEGVEGGVAALVVVLVGEVERHPQEVKEMAEGKALVVVGTRLEQLLPQLLQLGL